MSVSSRWRRAAIAMLCPTAAILLQGASAAAQGTEAPATEPPVTDGPCATLVDGTPASEQLIGSEARDRITGGDGRDKLNGLARGDCMRAGPGRDVLIGGPSADAMAGGDGPDRFRARDGSRDRVRCGPGRDVAVVDAKDRTRGCERVRRAKGRPTAPPPGEEPSDPDDPPNGGGCEPDLMATLTASGCRQVFDDSGESGNPSSLWGDLGCAASSRHALVGAGDPHPTAAGISQADSSSRRLTVIDGDDVWGERCEVGRNSWQTGPTAVYREDQRAITFLSLKLNPSFPLGTSSWQSVMQMKQAQPAANGSGTPMLSLEAKSGRWSLWQSDSVNYSDVNHQVWSTPATTETWTRFAFDIVYSQDPGVGEVTVYVDLNGDGDAADSGERSPTMRMATLKRETSGGTDDGISPGESIPSHLRVGVYHHPAIGCPPPGGCSAQLDNVQVVRP